MLNDWVWPLVAAPFIGSFLGVLIVRLPQGRPVAVARSVCDHCGAAIAPYDLLPLVSFAMLRGRCRRCGGRIAPLHWMVELAALAVAGSAVLAGDRGAWLWLDCGFGWTLLALGWIDWETMILPDMLDLPLILAGLGATLWLEPEEVADHAIAAVVGYAALRGIALLYRWLRGRDGMGEGDAKLLAAIGAWVGLEGLPNVVLVAALAGLAAALVMKLRGHEMQGSTAIPFGPFLALGGWGVRLLMAS